MYEYRIINRKYVLHRDGQPVGAPLDAVSMCIDTDDGVLHKHGTKEVALDYMSNAMAASIKGGVPWLVSGLVVLTEPLPVDEINKCIQCTGYAETLLNRLDKGDFNDHLAAWAAGSP